jgi:hypothetical protein
LDRKIQPCLFRVANFLGPGSVQYVLSADDPPASLMVVAASSVAGSNANGGVSIRPTSCSFGVGLQRRCD